MANEPDEVRSHSQDQPDPANPAEAAGSSPLAPANGKPAAPAGESAPADTDSPGEPPLKKPAPEEDGAAESDSAAGEGGPASIPGESSEEPASSPDASGHTEGGEWHDPSHAGETPDYYSEEQMYGGEGTGGSASGTVPEETSHHTTEEDYYHYPGEEAGSSGTDTASPNERTDESKTESDDSFLETDESGEEFGGPVKSFLEHLEDFRWVLIKTIAAVLVAMVVCLVATPTIIGILKWPLNHPLNTEEGTNQVMRLHFGTNVWELPLTTNQLGALNVGTNRLVDWDLVPTLQGTNLVLAVQPTPDPARTPPSLKVPDLVIIDPVEPFTIVIQLAIYGGIGLASPFILFFIGQFLVPALKRKERQYLYYGVGIGSGLFVAGVLFCYFVLLRVAVYATVQFAKWMGFSSEFWRGGGFLSFSIKFMVGMGLAFELPVVLLTLVKIGILDHQKLSKFRPYWMIVNLTLCGFITPSGDPFSMVLMAVPIHVLYELSYGIARYWAWRDRKREAAAAAAAGTE